MAVGKWSTPACGLGLMAILILMNDSVMLLWKCRRVCPHSCAFWRVSLHFCFFFISLGFRFGSVLRTQNIITSCDVLLTVHLSIFISVFNQLDVQNLFHNKFYFMPLHVSSTCAHHQEVKITLHSLCRCDDYQRLCNVIFTSFWPPDDEHMCSKHIEAWNKTYCETNFVHQVG